MTLCCEIVDVGDGVGSDFVNKELHVGSCNEGLAGSVQHDGVYRIVGVGGGHCGGQLFHDSHVQCVHGFWTVDGDGRNAVVDIRVHVGEGPVAIALFGEEGRNAPPLTGKVGVSLRHAQGFANTEAVHQFERTASPTEADFGTAVDVFHAAYVFVNDLGSHTEHHTEKALGDGGVLGFVVSHVIADGPLFVVGHEVAQVLSALVSGRVELFGQVVRGVQRNRRTGEVHQAEGAEANAESLAGDGVDLRRCRDAFLEQQTGLVQPRDEESVDDETGSVSAHDDHLAEHFAVLNHALHGGGAGGLGRNDLNQAVLGGVVEEVQTHKAVRSTGGFGKGVDGKRRRVGGEHGVGAAHLVQRCEHGGLDVKVFEDGLDHQIRVLGRVVHPDHTGDASFDGIHLVGRKDAPFHRFLEEVGNDALATLHPLGLAVNHLHVEFFLCTFLSNAGAHVAGSYHGDALNRLVHARRKRGSLKKHTG